MEAVNAVIISAAVVATFENFEHFPQSLFTGAWSLGVAL
jgi:hypothetical protein